MISAESLRELRAYYDALAVHPGSMGLNERARALNTSTALVELEAARTRIAELERDLERCNLSHDDLSVECQKIRSQGLSQEDREACLTGANFIEFVTAKTEPDSENQRIVIEMDRRKAAILRRLGGQT